MIDRNIVSRRKTRQLWAAWLQEKGVVTNANTFDQVSKERVFAKAKQVRTKRARATPQKKIWPEALLKRYVAEAAATCGLLAENEYRAIPGRRFRLDVAIPFLKLGFECDGWQYHAKHLEAWRKEKERDRLFLQHGWQVYRFAASEILSGAAKAEIARIVGEAKLTSSTAAACRDA